MKIGAGIVGILLGCIALLYVGLFGGIVGSAAGWLGSLGTGNATVTNWATVVSLISWLAPLVAIVGGIVTFSNPRAGGVLLAASACLLWYLLGLGMIGKIFVLPIAAAAVLAFLSAESASSEAASAPASTTRDTPGASDRAPSPATASFDRAKWNALLQYDTDIAALADRVRPLGQRWLDELASSFLALNDKTYLPEIERKIVVAAKAEAEEAERQKVLAEEQRQAFVQEQERLAQLETQQRERVAQERERQVQLWRDRLWGHRKARIRTITAGGTLLLIIAFIVGGVVVRRVAEQRKVARTALFIQAVNRGDWVHVSELIKEDVDVNAKGNNGIPILVVAASAADGSGDKVRLNAVTALLEHGADVNWRDDGGNTLLNSVFDPAVLSILLSHGAAVDVRNSRGGTALLNAAAISPSKVKQLIASHADVNLQDNYGNTPLYNAIYGNSLPSVKALVEHGARVNVKNNDGKTPLEEARGRPEIEAYLEAHGARGEVPIQLPSLFVQRDKPEYNAVFLGLFNKPFGTPTWLRESSYTGVEQYGRMVNIGGAKYEFYSVCKPHDCYGNFLYVLFTPGGGAAWALTTEDRGNFRFYGDPDVGLQAFLTSEAERMVKQE